MNTFEKEVRKPQDDLGWPTMNLHNYKNSHQQRFIADIGK
jgi:hypothetical protein